MEDEKINAKCKKCGSSKTYIRIKSKERVCQNCSYIERLK